MDSDIGGITADYSANGSARNKRVLEPTGAVVGLEQPYIALKGLCLSAEAPKHR